MADKIALITGITGQDGSYLSELLLKKGYDVHGIVRRTSLFNRSRIEGARERATSASKVYELHYGDLSDASSINRIIADVRPTELYNLAAQSHVRVSFEQPEYTCDVVATGVLRLLECIRSNKLDTRLYQASTCELFGMTTDERQSETTPFHPRSPYGVSKLYAYWIVKTYRDAYGMHASNGILFNHESPRRGENFVTRKITMGLARIKASLQPCLYVGNLEARRDWGHARDYVEAMWLMLQQDVPDDYVIATGHTHSVRQFIEYATRYAGFAIEWEGQGVDEVGRDARTDKVIVRIDPRYYRPTEVDVVCGDASKANRTLGWQPRISFEQLVRLMMGAELANVTSKSHDGTGAPTFEETLATH